MGLVELTESSFAFDRAGLRACVEMCDFCQMGRNPENLVVYTIGEKRFARFDFGFDDTVSWSLYRTNLDFLLFAILCYAASVRKLLLDECSCTFM